MMLMTPYPLKNRVIENELMIAPGGWGAIKPQAIINKYRYPANRCRVGPVSQCGLGRRIVQEQRDVL